MYDLPLLRQPPRHGTAKITPPPISSTKLCYDNHCAALRNHRNQKNACLPLALPKCFPQVLPFHYTYLTILELLLLYWFLFSEPMLLFQDCKNQFPIAKISSQLVDAWRLCFLLLCLCEKTVFLLIWFVFTAFYLPLAYRKRKRPFQIVKDANLAFNSFQTSATTCWHG